MKAGALFAGIGGFCGGFGQAGIETAWANDNDPHACETYKLNFPTHRVIAKDIRNLSVSEDNLEPVDILHAGFPCQSFSQAGNRQGFDDNRGMLFFQIPRLISEFHDRKPKVIVLENAPYLRYGEGGAWFLKVVQELQKIGYWFRDSNARELSLTELSGIPQQRVRLFMVALSMQAFRSGRFDFPAACFAEPHPLAKYVDFIGPVKDNYYLNEQNRYHRMIRQEYQDTSECRHVYQLRKYFVRLKQPGICPTLTANMGLGGHNVPFIWDTKGLRKLTEFECLRLQGFPETFAFPEELSLKQRYSQIGNAVAMPMAFAVGQSIAEKLTSAGLHHDRVALPG